MSRPAAAARVLALALGGLMSIVPAGHADTVAAADWAAYSSRFVEPDGRVIDDGNGGISHSEGQGYGLILAAMAGDEAGFDRIWSFTQTNLLLRDDGLAVWRYDPRSRPPVTDVNNATDGDILIAYGLSLGAGAFERPDLDTAAAGIATTVGATMLRRYEGRTLMKPGAAGFWEQNRPDAPVVNVSYWVFEALPVLGELAPGADWDGLARAGLALVAETSMGPRHLPPDWASLKGRPRPGQGFPAEFGYNAFRIPLYLVRAGITDRALLEPFRHGMREADGSVAVVDIASGRATAKLADPGYRIIPALVDCVLDGTRLPADLAEFQPTAYYPSTLHLLALAYLADHRPDCR
ncbi:glycosyl hydrolase family 8 [Methylobrevis albus]|uniref:cellulase n=1 Tax=Methylobrevis albus TaxID=2793297 RepID=A0A931I4A8_9HYPH|nr:glycosyl hydrolase family 8 [Methylobrevis albus]MBH0239234.1 endoglucanase [Methylobrevis albus]